METSMSQIRVKPARADMRMRHIPSGTDLPDEGGMWPADSFTFRRIADGDLIEVKDGDVPAASDMATDQSSAAVSQGPDATKDPDPAVPTEREATPVRPFRK
jgi:hypothetical protein